MQLNTFSTIFSKNWDFNWNWNVLKSGWWWLKEVIWSFLCNTDCNQCFVHHSLSRSYIIFFHLIQKSNEQKSCWTSLTKTSKTCQKDLLWFFCNKKTRSTHKWSKGWLFMIIWITFNNRFRCKHSVMNTESVLINY